MKDFLFPLILIFLIGCSKQTVQTSASKFPDGQKSYLSKCGSCHRIYDRLEFKPEQWDTIMVSMRKKAKITSDQEKEILLFLKERD